MWDKTKIELGRIKEGTRNEIKFIYTGDLRITKVKASCSSCSKIKSIGGVVTIIFTPNKVPNHLRTKGEYITEKKAFITMSDKSMQELTYKAIVEKCK